MIARAHCVSRMHSCHESLWILYWWILYLPCVVHDRCNTLTYIVCLRSDSCEDCGCIRAPTKVLNGCVDVHPKCNHCIPPSKNENRRRHICVSNVSRPQNAIPPFHMDRIFRYALSDNSLIAVCTHPAESIVHCAKWIDCVLPSTPPAARPPIQGVGCISVNKMYGLLRSTGRP